MLRAGGDQESFAENTVSAAFETSVFFVEASRHSAPPLLWRLMQVLGVDLVHCSGLRGRAELPTIAWGFGLDEIRSMRVLPEQILALTALHCPCKLGGSVRFESRTQVHGVLRGRVIDDQRIPHGELVLAAGCERALAWSETGPLWICGENPNGRYQAASGLLEVLNTARSLSELCQPANLAALAPLISFVHAAKTAAGWRMPGLRAQFMFDDPNLHSPRYGYLDFAALLRQARKHHFHVALATVPADAWYVHRGAGLLVRRNPAHLSLLMHGNAHTRCELARECSYEVKLRLLAQALSRVEKCELRTGIRIARLMTPPHGACTAAWMECMSHLGFEAACISTGSLLGSNPDANWRAELGVRPAEFVGTLPVIPRFRLASNSRNHILMAALLHRPIIMVGHHGDVAPGWELLGELAAFVNSLGEVTWTNLAAISRTNFAFRQSGRHIAVNAFANRFSIPIGNGIDQLRVRRPGICPSRITATGSDGATIAFAPQESGDACQLRGGESYEILLHDRRVVDFHQVPPPRMRVWPLLRRTLVEVRDRVQPHARMMFPKFGTLAK